jgi:glycosyltransferase involved in cell wall biosynthesis
MKILIAHSRYQSGEISGENRVVDDEAALLREGGHEVELWAPTPAHGRGASAKLAGRAVWSTGAVAALRRRLRSRRPEIVHLHNLFPMLSPAVIRTAASEGAAVVMTLHNYRLLCLPATFLRDGRPCELCLGRMPWRGVRHACYRRSRAASAVLAMSLGLHRAAHTFDRVTRFIAVSSFVRTKYLQAGFPARRIIVKPNFVPEAVRRSGSGDYFLFMGRLAPEKGLATLLRAWESVPARLVIAGEGEDERLLGGASSNVEYRGQLTSAEVAAALAGAKALLLPSLSYEGAPRSLLEAYAAGVPVIASAVGSLPELIADGESGLLVPPSDPVAWQHAVKKLTEDATATRMGANAHRLWAEQYSPQRALANIQAVYEEALAQT